MFQGWARVVRLSEIRLFEQLFTRFIRFVRFLWWYMVRMYTSMYTPYDETQKPETVASVVTIVTEMSRDRFRALETLEKGS